MAFDERNRETVEAFREYIEDAVAGDERYGDADDTRRDDTGPGDDPGHPHDLVVDEGPVTEGHAPSPLTLAE